MIDHFRKFSAYNQWANRRLFAAVGELTDHERQQDLGAFFGSLIGTLNHILVADLLWMERLEGEGPKPQALNTLLYAKFQELTAAREDTDQRLMSLANQQTEESLCAYLDYKTMAGDSCHDLISEIFTHIFNHQTHHRGQCHHMLNQLGKSPPPLDMIYFYRSRG